MPSRGQINLIVILISFPDQAPKASPESAEQLIFSKNEIAAGSLADYFSEVSQGRVQISGKVYGWFEAAHPGNFYANSHYGHQPETFPHNAGGLVQEAIAFAEKAGADFSLYDNSKQGAVDGLVVIFSGPGGNAGKKRELLWPWLGHLSMDGAKPAFKNGVKIDRYITVNEQNLRREPNFVPAFCHELGHLFGLPDLYDWNAASFGIGKFGLMGIGVYGGGKSFWPDAWSRVYLGWSEQVELTNSGSYKLGPAEKGAPVFKISTRKPEEYFLLENRQPLAKDYGLFGKGLVIYHIDESVLSSDDQVCLGFCPERHYLVSVEQADGLNQLERKANTGDASDFFPGSQRVKTFDDASGVGAQYLEGASSRLWSGEMSGIRLTRITSREDEVSFSLKLNKPRVADRLGRDLRLLDYKINDPADNNGLLEPGEEFELQPVIANLGAKAGKVKIILSASGLDIQEPQIIFARSVKSGERREISPGFKLKAPESLQSAKEIQLSLKIQTRIDALEREQKINLVLGVPDIILVMDDDGLGLKNYYENSFRQAGKVLHTIQVKDQLPAQEFLEKFKLVIWATGIRGVDGKPAIDDAREKLLSSLLDKGKNLLLVSPGIQLAPGSTLGEKLGIKSARFNDGIMAIKSQGSAPKTALLTNFYFPAITPSAAIEPADDAKVLYTNLQGDPVGIYFQNNSSSLIVITFPLEAAKQNIRGQILKEIMGKFGY